MINQKNSEEAKIDLEREDKQQRLVRLESVVIFSFVAVAVVLIYWGVLQTGYLNGRADNPRNVEEALRIRRGRIVDTQEIVLAQNGGTAERQVREYPLPVAEPVVGYYSLRHGTAGIEESLNSILTGDVEDSWQDHWRSVLNQPQVGQDVRLTIDIGLQANAVQLLEGKRGAALVMGMPEGAIRVMASMPTFDPNLLDESFDELVAEEDAPLVNRAAQGLYQPGNILIPFLTAVALEQQDLTTRDVEDRSIMIEMPALLERRWVSADLIGAWERFGLDQPPVIPLPVQEPVALEVENFAEAVRGEDVFTVTPLQVAVAASALGNEGVMIRPQIVSAVQVEDRWQAFDQTEEALENVIAANTAAMLLTSLSVPEENIVEWEAAVRAGPETINSWYVGLFPATDPRFLVVIVLEDEPNPQISRQIGRRLLQLTLN
ncbi:MAG: penicillin-binding transpeptidase domain-containing protein [Ardenticatenaceae bacterium]|nr:penicillin-binding transpeptidase domain-containing protein [Ardenticatenaceae bacterium]